MINPEIEKAWLKEAERRWREIEEGKVECIPAQEVMEKARKSVSGNWEKKDIIQALLQVKKIKEGKIPTQTADQLLDEL